MIDRYLKVPVDMRRLWIAVFFLYFGFGVYQACTTNFATNVIKVDPHEIGWIEAVRETPGFICVVLAALTMRVVEPVLGSIAVFLVAGGVGAFATINGVPGLLVWSLVWSLGLHVWMPLSSSLTMNLADAHNKGKRLGQTIAAGALGGLAGMSLVACVASRFSYPVWFTIAGAMIAVAGVLLLTLRRDIGHPDKPAMVWKSSYRLYYVLTFLEGCRKQVFFTFAIYTLTRAYNTPLKVVAILMVINQAVNMIGAPIVGRLIDRIGERRILMTSYAAVLLVFLGYASIKQAPVLYVLYCLDNLFYLSTVCLTTYIQKIAEPADLMPTLSMGVTCNHLAAVAVPLIGGYLWAAFSYPVMFYGGAVVVAISLSIAARMRIQKRAEAAA